MNALDRTLKALTMQECDRISVNPEIDYSYAAKLSGIPVDKCFTDEDIHAEALERVFDIHDVDGLYVNLCLSKDIITRRKQTGDGLLVTDACGIEWKVGENDVGSVYQNSIQSLDDERLITENPIKIGIVNTFRKIKKEYKEKYAIIPGITGPFSQVVFLYGFMQTLVSMLDEEEKLKEVIEARVPHAIKWADELIEDGAKVVWIGEGAASSSVISPGQYLEFVYPYQKMLVEHIKKRGAYTIIHVCGDINKSIRYIAGTGAECLDIDYMVDLADAKEAVGDRLCLKGNINPAELMSFNTNQVYNLSKEKIDIFGNKGFILSTGCLVCRDTPKENIDAMVQASFDLGCSTFSRQRRPGE
jgi:MtaA/CmuA family methyltransferase